MGFDLNQVQEQFDKNSICSCVPYVRQTQQNVGKNCTYNQCLNCMEIDTFMHTFVLNACELDFR